MNPDQLVYQAKLDQVDHKDKEANLVQPVQLARGVKLDLRDQRDHRDQTEVRDLWDQEDLKDCEGTLGHRELEVIHMTQKLQVIPNM